MVKLLQPLSIFVILAAVSSTKSSSVPDRRDVERELKLYELSLNDGIIDPFHGKAVEKRRKKRQAPIDVGDFGGGSGGGDENDFLSLTRNLPIGSPTGWAWNRITINFLNSVEYSERLQDFYTEEFSRVAFDIKSAMHRRLNDILHVYIEIIPLQFRLVDGDVLLMVDVGACLNSRSDQIQGALISMLESGTIGRFRVDPQAVSIANVGVEPSRPNCFVEATLPPFSTATSTSPRSTQHHTTTTTTPDLENDFDMRTHIPDSLVNAGAPPCGLDQATCGNRQCIERSRVCDGSRDCVDGSDESDLCRGNSRRCEPSQFFCPGTSICAQKIWRCDGDNDCGNRFDELNCGPARVGSNCSANQYQCSNGACIPGSHQCDGEADCTDGGDEMGCCDPFVIQPPRRRVSAVEGETVTLQCETGGTPTPMVTWRLNWGHVPDPPRVTMTSERGVGFLTIRKITATDQGAYTCEAMNVVNSILGTPDAIVSVEPRPPVSSPDPITTVTDRTEPCEPGEFNASPTPPNICLPCFCFGITDQCHPSNLQYDEIGINFTNPDDDNEGVILEPTNQIEGSPEFQQPITKNQMKINPPAKELQLIDLSKRFLAAAHYWSLPAQFLGAKINSYGGTLTFSFSYNNSFEGVQSPTNDPDVIIEGNGRKLFYTDPDPHPEPKLKHKTTVKLSEEANWKTADGENATREALLHVLQNIDRVLLRTVYDDTMLSTGIGDVKLQVAQPQNEAANGRSGETTVHPSPGRLPAYSVEECECPPGYTGMSCEFCESGYARVQVGPYLGTCIATDEQRGTPPDTICVEGYTGPNCQLCDEGYTAYEGECTRFPQTYCSVAGSFGMDVNNECSCKEGCEGERCDQCKSGYYFLSVDNVDGCLPCYCMNVTDECSSSNWYRSQIAPSFDVGTQAFMLKNVDTGLVFDDGIELEQSPLEVNRFTVTAPLERYPEGNYFWMLPMEFAGNKLPSYGGRISYTVSYDEGPDGSALVGLPEVQLTGNGIALLYQSGLQPRAGNWTRVSVPLKEEHWMTESGSEATREQLLTLLSDVDNFLIRASYSSDMRTSRIQDISLDSASPQRTGGPRALEVEQCVCPVGYTGLSCEDCTDGFYRVRSGEYQGQCRPCNCNQHAALCDKETGACLNCLHNTVGRHCDACADGYFGNARAGTIDDCKVCPCPITGDLCSVDCEGRPVCQRCPEGSEGRTCNVCSEGYERDPNNPKLCVPGGIWTPCLCDSVGSYNSVCDDRKQCNCKPSTTGKKCDQCRPGYFYLSVENPDGGCLPCFCMGITDNCSPSALRRHKITANFTENYGGFRLTQQACRTHVSDGFEVTDRGRTLSYGRLDQLSKDKPYYWQLPEEYRGNKVVSYGGNLEYKASFTTTGNGEITDDPDVIIIGNGVMLTSRKTYPDASVRPNHVMDRVITFREENWLAINGEVATREQLLMALADLHTILIRATYTSAPLRTTISDVSMETASDDMMMTEPAYEVEQCQCPVGYAGTSCEDCARGFTRSGSGAYLGTCRPCQCNDHSSICDPETGTCLECLHNTAGDRCERCADGYYGDATNGLSTDCRACACPGTGESSYSETCRLDASSNSLRCTACRRGYTGATCERCSPGYERDSTKSRFTCTQGSSLPMITVSIDEPRALRVREGTSVTFVCRGRSQVPGYVLAWSKRNGRLAAPRAMYDNGRLQIRNIRLSDTGTYVCTGSNEYQTARAMASLTVLRALGETPSAIVTPSSLRVTEGENARFHCNVRGRPTPTVEWARVDGQPMPGNAHTIGNTLMISSASMGDHSTYTCRASNSHGVVEARGALDVTISGTPPEVTVQPPSVTLFEGQSTSLTCRASGVPSPTVRWLKNDQVILSGSNLHIRSARLSDRGTYTCLASNGFGSARKHVTVTIRRRRPTRPLCRTDPKEVTAYVGTNSTINCVVGGNPMPVVHWETSDGSAFDSNVRTSGTELIFSNVRLENAGNYICVARNVFGTSRSTLILRTVKKDLPTIFISPQRRQQVRAGDDASFVCSAPGQSDVNVTWIRAGKLPFTGSTYLSEGNSRLNFRQLTKAEVGNYLCVATNVVGKRMASIYLDVIEPPIVTVLPSRTVTAQEGERIRLTCHASAVPIPSTIWIGGSPSRTLTHYRRRSNVYTINSVDASHAGTYTCRAINRAGTTEERLVLTVDRREPSRTPVVTISDSVLEGAVGNSMILRCSASGNPAPVVTWLKVNGDLPYGSRQIDGNLFLPNGDAGTYECVATSSAGRDSKRIILSYLPPGPDIPVVNPRNVTALVGQSAFFECDIGSSSDPFNVIEPRWLREEGVLDFSRTTTSGRQLRISPVQLGDTGWYMCTTTIEAAIGLQYAYLTVLLPSSVEVRLTPEKNEFVEGESLTITCEVTGYPRSSAKLLKDTAVLSRSGSYTIESLSISDSATYTCEVSGAAGSAEDSETITVREMSVTRSDRSTVDVRSGGRLTLNCLESDQSDSPQVEWLKDDGPLPSYATVEGTKLTIQRAGNADNGTYSCVARYLAERTQALRSVFVHAYIPYFSQTPNSYIAMTLRRNQFYANFNISISFKVGSTIDGLLLFANSRNGDFFSVSLNKGHIEFRFDLGSGTAFLRSPSTVRRDRSYSVSVSRRGIYGALKLDGGSTVTGRSPGEFRGLDLHSDLYIGGAPESLTLPRPLHYLGYSPGFYGCITQLDIGDGIVDFGTSSLISERVGIVRCRTCLTRGKRSCENRGKCVETHSNKDGVACYCGSGFGGETCQIPSSSTGRRGLTRRRYATRRGRGSQAPASVFRTDIELTSRGGLQRQEADQQSLMFRRSSHMRSMRAVDFHRNQLEVEMKVRLLSRIDALLFFSGTSSPSAPYFYLAIKNNVIEFRFQTATASSSLRVPASTLQTGSWQTVTVRRSRKLSEIVVNGERIGHKAFYDSGRLLLSAPLHVGAPHQRKLIRSITGVRHGFRGCVESIKVNKQEMLQLEFERNNVKSCADSASTSE